MSPARAGVDAVSPSANAANNANLAALDWSGPIGTSARLPWPIVANQGRFAQGQPVPGTNPPVLVNPTFAAEQEIWIKKVSPRTLPAGAEKFVPKLKTIFAAERVPAELVWLAEVESGFDSRARSPAGALGMFQIMPATGQ